MTRLEWDKANQRDKARRNRPSHRVRKGDVQHALSEFVRIHRIACFVCHTKHADWAKTGINKHGPWAICSTCIKRRKPSG